MQRDVLDAFAVEAHQEFLDLARPPCEASSFRGMRILPSGAVIALRSQAGIFALDVEIADLAEVEEPLVERRPNSAMRPR